MKHRTKSCATCRKRRIKCDATLPTCLMCSRFGRNCPGIDEGPIVVDMTPKARYGMLRRQQRRAVAHTEHVSSSPPTIRHVSTQAFVTEAFFGRFFISWTSQGDDKDIRNKKSWLHRLPILSTDGRNQALELALQSTAASYCALDLNDLALTRYSWELYGQAVQKHRQYLAQARAGHDEVTIHMISTSILFSFFEAMQSTRTDAYRSHVYGAAKMFEVTDPRQCHEGVLCQIFYHLRTQMAFVQLTSSFVGSSVDVSKILRDTLSYEELPLFQRLTTHITSLISMYTRYSLAPKAETGDMLGLVEYMTTKAAIDDLWYAFSKIASYRDEQLYWHDAVTEATSYRDAFTAMTIAYFSAAWILLSIVAPKLASSYPDLKDHYSSILDVASCMQTSRSGFAYMRMALPLLLVAMHGPIVEQRQAARSIIEDWSQGSMRGISTLALETIRRRQFVVE